MLRFSPANRKLATTAKALGIAKERAFSFNILAGRDCPYALECRSQVVIVGGKRTLVDGPNCQFRCYGASMERRLKDVYNLHKANSDGVRTTLKSGGVGALIAELDSALPPSAELVRIHSDGGDFFNRHYFLAWMGLATASHRRECRFYFYTKALPYIRAYADTQSGVDLSRGILTPNVRVTGSCGGTHDHLLEVLNLRDAEVVFSEDKAIREIDMDDTHAATSGGSFDLLLHAAQPSGSIASKAWEKIRRARIADNKIGA